MHVKDIRATVPRVKSVADGFGVLLFRRFVTRRLARMPYRR